MCWYSQGNDYWVSRQEACLNQLCRASQSDYAYVDASFYAPYEWVQQKNRKPLSCSRAARSLLQLRAAASYPANLPSDGGWSRNPAVEFRGYRGTDRGAGAAPQGARPLQKASAAGRDFKLRQCRKPGRLDNRQDKNK